MRGQRKFYLNSGTVQDVIDQHHMTQQTLAEQLGISRSHFSQLVNRRRSLTPAIRSRLVRSRYFKALPESELWDISEPEGGR